MGFNTIDFAIFFPLVTAGYFLLPHRFRWALLLLASGWFYMSFIPAYLLILVFTICVDYVAGRLIEQSQGRRRLYLLLVSVVANVGVLFFFKYINFFNTNISALAEFLHWNYSLKTLAVILPLGLSFHTFQSLSYTIEVYRGRQKAERHFGILALYVLFYPQLVAGPIERPQNLLHQFREEHKFDIHRFGSGLGLMLYGFVKKLVIADNLAVFVNQVYNNPSEYFGISTFIATIFFAFQVYCDFSGYSDIARGAARVMGFSLMENFRRPFFATSMGEFWRRWHISLSTWIRDYIFMPLAIKWRGLGRVGMTSALLVAFLFSGIWHGASWTFVMWGLILGVAIIFEVLNGGGHTKGAEREPWRVARMLRTFFIFCLSLLFFRAESLQVAVGLLRGMFEGWGNIFSQITTSAYVNKYIFLEQSADDFLLCLGGITGLILVEYLEERGLVIPLFQIKRFYIGKILLWLSVILAMLFVLYLRSPNKSQFIYFQF